MLVYAWKTPQQVVYENALTAKKEIMTTIQTTVKSPNFSISSPFHPFFPSKKAEKHWEDIHIMNKFLIFVRENIRPRAQRINER